MKMTEREVLIERIVYAARRKLPEIREIIHLEGSDGNFYEPCGFPRGVAITGKQKSMGFCYVGFDDTTYGKRYESVEAATAAWGQYQAKQDDDFRTALRGMTAKRLRENADFWLRSITATAEEWSVEF